jgi:sugar phosphate isomerase/epimerase
MIPSPFKLAICNEVFEGWNFRDACRAVKMAGYSGLEIAPFTLADDPTSISTQGRQQLRATMQDEELQFVGLHHLLKTPKGLHMTTPDDSKRAQTWDYLRRLVDLCADLGEGGIMVFGGAQQRSTEGGSSVRDAMQRFRDGLGALAPFAQARNVTLIAEPLSPELTDVLCSLEEAERVITAIKHPAVATMFDFHNAIAEKDTYEKLIRRYSPVIRHIHLNEYDGRHPGSGTADFKSVLRALRECRYSGWISVEVFDFQEDPQEIARESFRFLRAEEAMLPAQ